MRVPPLLLLLVLFALPAQPLETEVDASGEQQLPTASPSDKRYCNAGDSNCALSLAAWRGDAKAAARLIKEGTADVNKRAANNDGKTPLRLAAERGHAAVVAVLLSDGDHTADPNIADTDEGWWDN